MKKDQNKMKETVNGKCRKKNNKQSNNESHENGLENDQLWQ